VKNCNVSPTAKQQNWTRSVASFQDNLGKPLSEYQTILYFIAAGDDEGGRADNRNA